MNTNKKKYTLNNLLEIMKVLRSDNGCPWDKAQDHQSIKYALLEEACEAMESLDKKGYEAFADELGDVLLQVVFHSQIGSENGTFTIDDVLNKICTKLITRHTHIFGDDKSDSSDNALDIWEQNKKKEKGLMSTTEIMKDVCSYLPQLIRAEKVQKKAAKVGFDLDNIDGAYDKLKEEVDELKSAKTQSDIEEEFGDLLFSCVNIARFLKVNPEEALKKATDKFINRFEKLENKVVKAGKNLEEMTLSEMDEIWDRIKHK
jgi:tetrapyrrole methylase family protein/MazG family protein